MSDNAKCPVMHGAQTSVRGPGTQNEHWWPNQLNLSILHQHTPESDPLGQDFNYRKAFKKLDYQALKEDLRALMTKSQPWWPADYGLIGLFFTEGQWEALEALFADGVCDFNLPGEAQQHALTWLTYQDQDGGQGLPPAPPRSGSGWASPAFRPFQ
jgi:hypothetical protein